MKITATIFLGAAVMMCHAAHAQSNDLATGNLHFSAAEMDANGDHMITKDEFMQYGSKLWSTMSHGASTVSVTDAAQAFARGNLKFNAKLMDADHNGTISQDEFMAYGAKKFDHMKGKDGMMSVADASKNFARGNRHSDSP